MKNDVEIIQDDISEIVPNNGSAFIDTNIDNILYLAERAEKAISALKRIMEAAIGITNELDWVLIGGKPYLQESGATKVSSLFGISISLAEGYPTVSIDNEGYKTFTYRARFSMKDKYIDCDGARNMKDDFFAKAGKDKPLKKPDEIDERDVKLAAYTNCLNNGIKRLIPGLRNIDVSTLERAGLDVSKISGYTFKEGSKGGASKEAEDTGLKCEKCGTPIDQKVASYSQSYFGGHMYCRTCQQEVKASAV